jgi:hypothetical protein
MACTRVPLLFLDGGVISKVTPGGMESGMEPILDWHDEVVVKVLDAEPCANAGSRKMGIESVCCVEGRDTNWAHRRRAGANMMVMLAVMLLAQISGVAFQASENVLSHLKSRDRATCSSCDFLFTRTNNNATSRSLSSTQRICMRACDVLPRSP